MQISYQGTPSMDRSKQRMLQLCSSLATKMTEMDEKIVDKSNMLFKVRELTADLMEQQRQLQQELSNLVIQQGEVLQEFAELYELVEQSLDSHEVLGDKPTESGESTKKNTTVEYKSTYDDSTIHTVNLGNINPKTNNEQSSSSGVMKNNIVRIKGSVDSKNENEKEL